MAIGKIIRNFYHQNRNANPNYKLLTPSFLSLSIAPYKYSIVRSSFSSSHIITKGSNQLRIGDVGTNWIGGFETSNIVFHFSLNLSYYNQTAKVWLLDCSINKLINTRPGIRKNNEIAPKMGQLIWKTFLTRYNLQFCFYTLEPQICACQIGLWPESKQTIKGWSPNFASTIKRI